LDNINGIPNYLEKIKEFVTNKVAKRKKLEINFNIHPFTSNVFFEEEVEKLVIISDNLSTK